MAQLQVVQQLSLREQTKNRENSVGRWALHELNESQMKSHRNNCEITVKEMRIFLCFGKKEVGGRWTRRVCYGVLKSGEKNSKKKVTPFIGILPISHPDTNQRALVFIFSLAMDRGTHVVKKTCCIFSALR